MELLIAKEDVVEVVAALDALVLVPLVMVVDVDSGL